MTNLIDAIGKYPGVYVLVTLRSDASMILGDPGNTEPTGIPSDSTNTPDKTKFPAGTDAVYTALVDTFAHSNFVLFESPTKPAQVPQSGFYADMEPKMIPNLAWDFDDFSGCAPDRLDTTKDPTKLQPTAWGMTVQGYLTMHAQ